MAPLLARLGSAPSAFDREGADASREDADAPGARSALIEDRRRVRQRDRAAARRGAVDRPVDLATACRRRTELAAAGRDDR